MTTELIVTEVEGVSETLPDVAKKLRECREGEQLCAKVPIVAAVLPLLTAAPPAYTADMERNQSRANCSLQ